MKCSDIPEKPILDFLAKQERRSTWYENSSMPTVCDAMPAGTPAKLRKAKMSKLIRRGLVSGCDCGCRGDYEITAAGRKYLAGH